MKNNSALFNRFVREYWEYYRELEDDLLATRKYISFDEANFSTYSLEYLKLFQAVCSEIDVVGKAMAFYINDEFNPASKNNNIYKWWHEIQDSYHLDESYTIKNTTDSVVLAQASCKFLDRFEVTPWSNFKTERYVDKRGSKRIRAVNSSTPKWWSSYNAVKHSRIAPLEESNSKSNFEKANLGNVVHAYAGLFLLEYAFLTNLDRERYFNAFENRSHIFE